MVFSQLLWFILNKMPEFSLIECVSTSVVLVLKMFTHITTIISFMKASVNVKSKNRYIYLSFLLIILSIILSQESCCHGNIRLVQQV